APGPSSPRSARCPPRRIPRTCCSPCCEPRAVWTLWTDPGPPAPNPARPQRRSVGAGCCPQQRASDPPLARVEHSYSLLNTCSGVSGRDCEEGPVPEELTAEERILQAALRRFAVDGLSASLRRVASDAGVSAGLIIHHYGSGEKLLAACDSRVLE